MKHWIVKSITQGQRGNIKNGGPPDVGTNGRAVYSALYLLMQSVQGLQQLPVLNAAPSFL